MMTTQHGSPIRAALETVTAEVHELERQAVEVDRSGQTEEAAILYGVAAQLAKRLISVATYLRHASPEASAACMETLSAGAEDLQRRQEDELALLRAEAAAHHYEVGIRIGAQLGLTTGYRLGRARMTAGRG